MQNWTSTNLTRVWKDYVSILQGQYRYMTTTYFGDFSPSSPDDECTAKLLNVQLNTPMLMLIMNDFPVQVRFNTSKSSDMAMCKRYEQSGSRAGTLRIDVLYQMVLAMAYANYNGSIKIDELQKIIELVDGSSSQDENKEPV